jgi:hypothetical protein
VSCNEFRSTIWEVCTGKNQFGTRMTCRGTHQGMPWAAHGLSWDTSRQAVACLGQPMAYHGTQQGMPWQASAPHGQAMAHTKACHGSPWLAMAHTEAWHGLPWHPMGKPWHTPRHFLKQYLEFGRDILHTCLEKSYLRACQVLRFLEKTKIFFNFFN